ncbi:MAG: hypothetical protein ACUZ8E_07985 [Candidatus Anammoxibacter sp.]
MPHPLVFDTHAYVKKLQAVGFTEEQAEVQTEVVSVLIDEQLATKQDLKELEVCLKRDLKELETNLRSDILEVRRDMKELELRMLIRLGAIQAVGIAVVAALVKLL